MKNLNKKIRKIRRETRDIIKSYRDDGYPSKNIPKSNPMAAKLALEFVEYMYIDISMHPITDLLCNGCIIIGYDDGDNSLYFEFYSNYIIAKQNFMQGTKRRKLNSIEEDIGMLVMLSKLFFKKNIGNSCEFTREFNPPTKEDLHIIELLLKQEKIASVHLLIKNDTDNNHKGFNIEEREKLIYAMIKNYPNVYLSGYTKSSQLISVNGRFPDHDGYLTHITISEDDLDWIIKQKWNYTGDIDRFEHYYVLQKHLNSQAINRKCQNVFKKNQYTIIDTNGEYPDVSYDEVIGKIENKKKFQNLVPDFVYEEIIKK